jgi:hypothetical protein
VAQLCQAAQILVEFDSAAGHGNAGGQGAIGMANFAAATPFTSRGFANGSLIRNASMITLQDLELTLAAGNTFDPKSTGGAAFPNVQIINNGQTIILSGGNIAPGASFWSQIPLSAPFPGGVGTYTGLATPELIPAPMPVPAVPNGGAPKAGNDSGSAQINYNGAGTLSFAPGSVTFVQYSDGTIIHSNNPTESIIGSPISIGNMTVTGPSSTIPGAFLLSDSSLSVATSSSVYLSATLTNDLIYPDPAHPGMDILQATLVWQESQTGSNSQYISQLYSTLGITSETTVFWETSILSATNGLTTSGSSEGNLIITNASVPEPGTAWLLGLGLAGSASLLVRRATRRTTAALLARLATGLKSSFA